MDIESIDETLFFDNSDIKHTLIPSHCDKCNKLVIDIDLLNWKFNEEKQDGEFLCDECFKKVKNDCKRNV